MNKNQILNLAVEAGKLMLENGGETYRVEETMIRIAIAFGLKEADGYATPTVLMLCCKDEDDHNISKVKRITNRTLNLDKIDKINALSRSIEKKHLTGDEVKSELQKINTREGYSQKIGILFSAIIGAAFTLLFGGCNFYDFIIAFFIGGLVKCTTIFLSDFKVDDFFINIASGAEAALLAIIVYKLGLPVHYDNIIIADIMLLVPGIAITNAIRDTINGDLLSGISRAIEAFFVAVAIAVGTGMIFKIWFSFFGGV